MGDYGPDAGSTNPNRGPQGSVEYNVVKEPGFYGWPYCVRENVPYNDFNFTHRRGRGHRQFNCAAPVNNSPNNTGLTNLPPAIPATMWMGYTETDARFPDLGGGGAPTGGPRYYYDAEPHLRRPSSPRSTTATGSSASGTTAGSRRPRSNDEGARHRRRVLRGVHGLHPPDGHRVRPRTARSTSSSGARASTRTTPTPASTGSTTSRARAGRSPTRRSTSTRCPSPLTVNFSSAGSNDPDGTVDHVRVGLRGRHADSTAAEPDAHVHGRPAPTT